MTREAAADEFFALTGHTVDQRIQYIARTAGVALRRIKTGTCPYKPAAVSRWAVRSLEVCSVTFERAPPVELVELIRHQLGVDVKKRNGARKNREKFIAAAGVVAQYPDATLTKIARAIKYDQKAIIQRWLQDQEFQEIVGIKRLRLAHQQKKSG